jgi:hypothetical protein
MAHWGCQERSNNEKQEKIDGWEGRRAKSKRKVIQESIAHRYVYVCVYVCMYVCCLTVDMRNKIECVHACMYVYMHVCMFECMYMLYVCMLFDCGYEK